MAQTAKASLGGIVPQLPWWTEYTTFQPCRVWDPGDFPIGLRNESFAWGLAKMWPATAQKAQMGGWLAHVGGLLGYLFTSIG